ncbi:oxygen-independent coproporphyrinogen III oxidase [uncultured Flavobacterium sp.]|uniref:oxygen-independent coproporphyrinogen III oxidase n=1 Tax=uncultured Flavobacterium sp. TaxID=165435 RepID=UPI0025FF52BE|nr:oxygen-independent coproporphyrinogen III oxidase [uncultured Flavobacterium sp.]
MKNPLLQKYNVPGPRYTSYPTVPYWEDSRFGIEEWKSDLVMAYGESNAAEGMSLYIHLPFCESMCTFCGCHKRITKRHEVELPYINAVLKEWAMYRDLFKSRPRIKELHLGGGTPTFFAPENLRRLINGIFELADAAPGYEFSFEGHPNNTTREHLETLHSLGFRRVSFGVQDYGEKVQTAINRIQPFQNVARATQWARDAGFTSISHDLVFGLPHQTIESVVDTIEKTKALHPDRIAFYSYAHVPWIKGTGQRGFDENHLPKDADKRMLYEIGKELLLRNGYHEIGMDHFALESDAMYKSFEKGTLHRNFMGYNASRTKVMVGLGVSAISDSWYSFAQNEKNLEDYYKRIGENQLPVFRGHLLNSEDLTIRQHILNLMCRFETNWDDPGLYFTELPDVLVSLAEMAADGLIVIGGNYLIVTEKGKAFVRNICMAFDLRLKRKAPETKLFSMTI